ERHAHQICFREACPRRTVKLNASPSPGFHPSGECRASQSEAKDGRYMWSGPKGATVQERLDRAAEAKKALLDRFKKQPGPGDKEYEERQAQLKAVAEARRQREEARARQKAEEDAARAEAARVKAEADAKAAQEAAEKAAKLAAEEGA